MSSKYHGTNTLVHNVSRNIIESEILDKIDRTSSTSKNQRNEFLFSSNREKDVTNYKYLGKGNEHVRNEREHEAIGRTFPKYLKSEEPNNCKTYYAEGINNSKESTEADLKKKKITEIIDKYRNQLKMMHGQFSDSIESGRKNEKGIEKNSGQKYDEKNKNNQTRLNEVYSEQEIRTVQRGIPYELHTERELVGTVTRNNKEEVGVKSYLNERWTKHSTVKQLELERGCETKYDMGTELYQQKIFTDLSKMGKEKEISINNEKLHKGDVLHQFEENEMVPHFMEDANNYDNSSLQHKKRMYIDLERAKQIDFKKEQIFKSKNRKNTEDLIEEKEETIENGSKKTKVAHENEDDDMFPLRRFFYDSIAFDEFKIKDKFKEIEQIEQIIRSKNLLSPVKDIKEKEETYTGQMNVENINELSGNSKTGSTNLFNETKEIGVTVEDNIIEGKSGMAHLKNVYAENFSAETSKENKEEKGNDVLKNIYNSQRYSVVMNEKRGNNTLDYKYTKETGVNKEGQKDEEAKSTNESLPLKFLNVEKYVNTSKNRNQYSECNNVINNINEINNTTNITNNSTNITNTVTNTINSNSNVTQNNNSNKGVEENIYYIKRLHSKNSTFPIQDLIRKEEVQLVADHKENLCEKKNMSINKNIKKSNTDERRNHFLDIKLSNKNELSSCKMEDPLCIEKNDLKYKEDIEKKWKKIRTSYYNEEKLTKSCNTKEINEQKDNSRNSEMNDYHKLNMQNCSLLKKKLEEKINGKDIPRIKENILEGIEKNSLKNRNLKCLINEGNGILKQNVLSNEADDTINTFKEGKKTYTREDKESSLLFLTTFTHDRKLETTIKTAYAGEFRNSNFAVNKKINSVKKPTYIEGQHLLNAVEKEKIDEVNELQQKGMIHLSEKETKQNGTDDGSKYETWYSKSRFRNNDNTKKITENNTNELKDSDIEKNEQMNKNIQMQMKMNPSVSLNQSMDIPILTKTCYKTDYVMNKTHKETFNDNQQFINNAICKEPNISEKYKKNYKMLEKLRADLEEKTKQNQFFFSMNYSQNRNKSLRYKKVPDSLYVTYNESSSFPKKTRDSIIKDKVFDDDNDVKEEGKENVKKNLEQEYIKDKKQSIEQIQKELEIMKRYKNGENIEDIHERMIRDEINQKRKLYEEKIRKNFEEKIKLRRKMLEQQKYENEKQGHKTGTTSKEYMSENEQGEHGEEMEKVLNCESEKKKRRIKNRNIFDEYSSDGSYYRHLYKNLYDDECSKKWKNQFYDVSDNLYLQECSDIFFSNLKKRPSEDTSLTNSFDIDLISLSKIKFDEFDYNYLNKIEKEPSLLTKQNNTVNFGNDKIDSLEKEISPTCSLKKPQVVFSDDSEKENLKCDDIINGVVNVNVNNNVLNISTGEKENPILCKLVKRKNKENQKNNNWSEFIAEDAILNDSVFKNIEDDKETVKEVTLCKEYEPFCINKQEEIMPIGNKETRNEGLNNLLCRTKNTGVNEIYTIEIPKTIDVERNMLAEKKGQHNSDSSKLKKNLAKKKTLPVKSNNENSPFKMPNLKKTNLEKSRSSLEKHKLNLEKQKQIIEKQKPNLEKQKQIIEKQNPDLEKPKQIIEKQKQVTEKQKQIIEKQKPDLEKPKQIIEKLQKKEVLLERKVSRKIDTLNDSTNNNGKNVMGGNLEKHMSSEIPNGNKKKNDMSYIMLEEKKLEVNTLEDKKKNTKIEELKKEETTIDTVKDSSSSSNKTMPKINILQNKENYIPLDLALNFVMDNQKLEKQVKKEKEIQKPNKKKTFTQWVMEERKKRLKNNLPIDI